MTVLVEDKETGEPGVEGLNEIGKTAEGGFDDRSVRWHSWSISGIWAAGRTVGSEKACIEARRFEAYGNCGVAGATARGCMFGKKVGDKGDNEIWCIQGLG